MDTAKKLSFNVLESLEQLPELGWDGCLESGGHDVWLTPDNLIALESPVQPMIAVSPYTIKRHEFYEILDILVENRDRFPALVRAVRDAIYDDENVWTDADYSMSTKPEHNPEYHAHIKRMQIIDSIL